MTSSGKNVTDAGQSTDEEPLKKIFDDAMKLFDKIDNGSEATNSNGVQVRLFRFILFLFIV